MNMSNKIMLGLFACCALVGLASAAEWAVGPAAFNFSQAAGDVVKWEKNQSLARVKLQRATDQIRTKFAGASQQELSEELMSTCSVRVTCGIGICDRAHILIKCGADVNYLSPMGFNSVGLSSSLFGGLRPLHVAVQCKNFELAKFLVAQGADIDACDVNGNTPLQRLAISQKVMSNRTGKVPLRNHNRFLLNNSKKMEKFLKLAQRKQRDYRKAVIRTVECLARREDSPMFLLPEELRQNLMAYAIGYNPATGKRDSLDRDTSQGI